MEFYFNKLLSTEITPIPILLDEYIGNYYSNTVFNGATWLFVLLYIFHEIIDSFLAHVLNLKLYKREYLRVRIKRAIWSFSCYTIASYFFSAIIIKDVRNIQETNNELTYKRPLSSSLQLEFVCFSIFFLHSAVWDLIKYRGDILPAINNFLLSLVIFSQYHLRTISIYYKIMLVICLRRNSLEFLRLQSIFVLSKEHYTYYLNNTLFIMYFVFSFVINFLIIPLTIITPFSQIALKDTFSTILFFIPLTWYLMELLDPVLLKLLQHWFYHNEESVKNFKCCGHLIHCAIYSEQDDLCNDLILVQREVKKRRAEMMAKRKPKNNQRMFVQTLKCMAVLKKKLNDKRLSEVLELSGFAQFCAGSDGSTSANNKQKKAKQSDKECNKNENEDNETTSSDSTEELVNGKLQIKITNNDSESVEESDVSKDASNTEEINETSNESEENTQQQP